MEVIVPLGIFAATFLVCWVVRRLVLRALKAWTARTESRAGSLLYEALRGPTLIWALILAAHLAFQGSDLPVGFTAPVGEPAARAVDRVADADVHAAGGKPGAALRQPGSRERCR